MKQLKQLIVKLNNDELCAVDIYDKDLDKYLHRNFTHHKIASQFNNAEDLFDNLLENGHENLTINEKRKSGNAFKYIGDEFTIAPEVKPKETKSLVMEKIKSKKKKKKKNKKSDLGLGFGLSMADNISLHTKANKLDEMQVEFKELKAEHKEALIKIKTLEEDALLKKYTKENNDDRNRMIMTVVKEAPGILSGLGFKVPVPPSGLGNAVQDVEFEEYSQEQSRLIDIVKNGDDSTNEILLSLVDKINEGNEAFSNQFYNFLVIHKIVNPNEN
ncbi:hypothetical protein [Flavobacterium sp.]|uniref:hypothetical protein n=1 Tax=Flavobacterium sp. TaxID=239 RepID=UPI003750330B